MRLGQVNFDKDQKFFDNGEADQIRSGIPHIVNQVRDEIDKDILATKKPRWTSSVGIVGHPQPDELTQKLFQVKAGLLDEKPMRPRIKQVYAGTDTRDIYHTGWNVSTESVHPRDSERFIQAT